MKPPLPRSRKATIWLVTGLAYLVFAILAWLLGSWLALTDASVWVLRVGLWVLGLVAAGLVVWFFARSRAENETDTAPPGGDDVDTTLAAAAARLASAQAVGTRALRSLPMVVVLGPDGSTKTTVIVHSGLDPELLAGEVFHGDAIGPTPGVNVWYTQHTVLLEAGSKLAADGGRWSRLIRLPIDLLTDVDMWGSPSVGPARSRFRWRSRRAAGSTSGSARRSSPTSRSGSPWSGRNPSSACASWCSPYARSGPAGTKAPRSTSTATSTPTRS